MAAPVYFAGMTPQRLSVVVIAQDEEHHIGRCLESASWADELLVVDSGSSDRTIEIARRSGARVVERQWSGYVDQKNAGVDSARYDWILSLDADEWLSEGAAKEIRGLLKSSEIAAYGGYRIRRRTAFCGEYIRTWSRDRPLRLFDRRAGRFSGGSVHESVKLDAEKSIGSISGPIWHLGYESVRDYVERINIYTDLAAEDLAGQQRRPRYGKLLLGPFWSCFRNLILRGGILDGWRGAVVAFGSAYYVLLREAKLYERLARKRRGEGD
jgi:glycosyltransferase involved in cell wall biosynthesis